VPSFSTGVEGAFGFLCARGFTPSSSEREVRFESPVGVFVRVFYTEREQHVGLQVGLVAEPRDALTEAEMLVTGGAGDLPGLFTETDDFDTALGALADRLQRYGERALAGDAAVFEEATALRRMHTARYVPPLQE
jgi:hypothetical protein